MKTRKPLFRYADGRVPNTLAMTYALLGYIAGLALLFPANGWLNALGTLLLGHAMIIAAYLIHEFAHGTIFSVPKHNQWAGNACSWLAGSCYADFQDLRKKHMRHHVDRADVITFDSKAFLKARPLWFQKLVVALEWAYVPAVELIMHGYVIVLPFVTRNEKHRARRDKVAQIMLIRALLFGLLGWFSLKALVLYAVAWMLMVTVLRFADAYQHTYDAFAVLEDGQVPENKQRDRAYEQVNTFSNVVSARWPSLNLLLLNFPYHNAHHEKPVAPWYRLPALHAELYGSAYNQVIPMRDLLGSFHRYRLRRVLDDDYGSVGEGPQKADGFYGAVGVSFLTAV
ncbi:fatty acid desaturase [Pseudomonas sp. Choline-3u-10]|jgi:fatty acid desaturase|uniref:fatty acid desaturase family protein n=2 Tax=Pseudomonadales TaxID=72274 RepID=UPI00061831F7|nr:MULTISPECIES: fatty acid desaturase [Pseudomonadaceae]MAL34875.1 fatty acid desaturase [Pseudomonas sp.]MBU0950746.1 fatty acid desaturase [Gammaproteobacteria bacterium]KJJ65234.1 fatty acid desaturase [Pseudomonas sp. 10B238]MBK3795536.1 fatty acid desaturase [Stutzerimonas stutzeri]MBK3878109.1 fatty acid desaturase [Stutzerimonas stutzeri]|tara:strand:- start:46 stop:1068 length:1023 start_codon:yes stop_codon:yes gene_type:complete